jgi:putative MATE family efflux protein
MKTALIGNKEFYTKAASIGLPIAVQSLLTTSGSMVDTVMIGTQGELAVAAVGICAQFASLLFSAFFGFFSGGVIFFAQYWGAKNEKGISRAYGLTLCCMMLFGLLFGALALFAPEWVLSVYTDKTDIQRIAVPYLRILSFALPLQVLAFAVSGLMRSTEQVKIPLYASIAALMTNVFLNWVLIYGNLGFAAMGVEGAAIATVAGNAVNVIVLYIYCVYDKQRPFMLDFKNYFNWDWAFVKQYFSKSLFIVANEVFMGIGWLITNIIMGRQDEMAIAALAVFRVIEGIVFSFFRGFTSAGSVMVGMEVGAGTLLKGYTRAKQFVLLTPVSIFLVCFVQFLFREPLLGVFNLGSQASSYGKQMLVIYIAAASIRMCNWICNDIFRAGGESVFGTVVEIVCMYVFTIPALLLAGLTFHAPFAVVFACMYSDDIVRICLIVWYMNSGKWVKPVTEEGRAALPAFRNMLRAGKTTQGGYANDGRRKN